MQVSRKWEEQSSSLTKVQSSGIFKMIKEDHISSGSRIPSMLQMLSASYCLHNIGAKMPPITWLTRREPGQQPMMTKLSSTGQTILAIAQ
jgi:hypothetical protein